MRVNIDGYFGSQYDDYAKGWTIRYSKCRRGHIVQIGPGAQPASRSLNTGIFMDVKRPEYKFDYTQIPLILI